MLVFNVTEMILLYTSGDDAVEEKFMMQGRMRGLAGWLFLIYKRVESSAPADACT